MEFSKEQLIMQLEFSLDILKHEVESNIFDLSIELSDLTDEELLLIILQNEALMQAIGTRAQIIQYINKRTQS